MQGVHPRVVQQRLGHANVAITLGVYSHVLPGLDEAAAQRFESALDDAPKPLEKTVR
jgi:integrase